MRWSVLKTLLHKELLRHAANRGGLVLLMLLVVFALLLSLSGGAQTPGSGIGGGVRQCYVDHATGGGLVDYLRRHMPEDMKEQIKFRDLASVPTNAAGVIVYPQSTGAIQLRPADDGSSGFVVWLWHPGEDSTALAPYEAWFWKETLNYYRAVNRPIPAVVAKDTRLEGAMDARSGLASSLVLFGLFFVCVYLLPSLTCEERERGVLLAQVLSPASTAEILAAKFLFYPGMALVVGAGLAALYRPGVILVPFFWLALTASVLGSMGVGLVIASLARTQRAASMGAMSYLLCVAVLLMICQQCGIRGLPYVALEYHVPRMIHAALTGPPQPGHWGNLTAVVVLAAGWTTAAAYLFRRYGWQ
jgi:ABC-2 family transporter protein